MRDRFVSMMMPHALRVSQKTGLDPRVVIAQAAQETGWGKSAPNNNYFGIKSHNKPGGAVLSTKEYVNGSPTTVQDSFRGYEGPGQSADDYADFLMTNPRYKQMLAANGLDAQVEALGQSGYATDPNYASSVGSIARSIELPNTKGQTVVDPYNKRVPVEQARLANDAMLALGKQPQYDLNSAVVDPGNMPMGPQGGAPAPEPALAAQSAEGGPQGGFWEQLQNGSWLTPDRQDAILAIGTGLLQGDNWSEGFSGVGQNLMQMGRDQNQQESAMQRMMAQGMLQQASSGGPSYGWPDQFMDDEGTFIATFDKASGSFIDPEGNDVSSRVQGAQMINNSTATFEKEKMTYKQANDARAKLKASEHQLKTFDRVIEAVESDTWDTGFSGMWDELNVYYDALANQQDLSPEEIARKAAQGELSMLIGGIKDSTGEVGMLTNQDIERMFAALGGNLRSFFSNPQVAAQLLSQRRQEVLESYNSNYDMYKGTIEEHGQKYPVPDRYTPPNRGALDSSNSNDVGAPPDGVSDLEWQHMTPEERDLFR